MLAVGFGSGLSWGLASIVVDVNKMKQSIYNETNKFFTSSPVFIIAELSANHNNDDLAVKTREK